MCLISKLYLRTFLPLGNFTSPNFASLIKQGALGVLFSEAINMDNLVAEGVFEDRISFASFILSLIISSRVVPFRFTG